MKSFVDFVNEAKIAEMASGDINVQAVLHHFDTGDTKRKDEIAEEISGHPHHDRNRILNDLRDFGYEEIQDSMDKLGIVA